METNTAKSLCTSNSRYWTTVKTVIIFWHKIYLKLSLKLLRYNIGGLLFLLRIYLYVYMYISAYTYIYMYIYIYIYNMYIHVYVREKIRLREKSIVSTNGRRRISVVVIVNYEVNNLPFFIGNIHLILPTYCNYVEIIVSQNSYTLKS
ncbi:hypothetical protein PUN28_012248 [Cardiocondyla obscurior]|uniref:Uncharacterized protein n=1 Tax=Cardiocondyla obscurior TaxID=286306 RepID=A0AAW2FFB3_9HYME